MILLITTSKSLLTLDTNTNKISTIHTGMGLYYGIAASKTDIYVAARNNSNPFDYLGKPDEQGVILVFNKKLEQVRQITAPFALRDMHQIMYFDNKLWVTCSQDNMVAIYNGETWHKWYPSPDKAHRGEDINHFNSLWVHNNQIHVLAHNLGRQPSAIYRYSYPSLSLLETKSMGNQAHNIWVCDDPSEYYVCDSANGAVVSTSGKQINIGGFPRGVVISNNAYFIGTSDVAERDNRAAVNSKVKKFNKAWECESTIDISNNGQLLDIKALN